MLAWQWKRQRGDKEHNFLKVASLVLMYLAVCMFPSLSDPVNCHSTLSCMAWFRQTQTASLESC